MSLKFPTILSSFAEKLDMSNTAIYTIVIISLLHFVAAIVFLLRKLSAPHKGERPPEEPPMGHR